MHCATSRTGSLHLNAFVLPKLDAGSARVRCKEILLNRTKLLLGLRLAALREEYPPLLPEHVILTFRFHRHHTCVIYKTIQQYPLRQSFYYISTIPLVRGERACVHEQRGATTCVRVCVRAHVFAEDFFL